MFKQVNDEKNSVAFIIAACLAVEILSAGRRRFEILCETILRVVISVMSTTHIPSHTWKWLLSGGAVLGGTRTLKRCFLSNGERDVLIKTPTPPTQLISFDSAARCVTSSVLSIPELLACLIFENKLAGFAFLISKLIFIRFQFFRGRYSKSLREKRATKRKFRDFISYCLPQPDVLMISAVQADGEILHSLLNETKNISMLLYRFLSLSAGLLLMSGNLVAVTAESAGFGAGFPEIHRALTVT